MEINASTRFCCLLGNPVQHSLSPSIHNALFEKFKLNYAYAAFNVENLEYALHGIRALNIAGASITIPFKSEVMHFLDRFDAISEKIGAVNTVVNEKGRLMGFNTDSNAAISVLEKRLRLHNKKIALIGAGGAGRAIAFGAVEKGASVLIIDKDSEKAGLLAKDCGGSVAKMDDLQKTSIDILINATPVGMFPNVAEMPVPKNVLKKDVVVFDIIYNPLETKLLKEAKKSGCKIVPGYEMFALQAAKQFELWTGTRVPVEFVKDLTLTELKKGTK